MKMKWRIILAIGVIGIALVVGALPDWLCLQKAPKDITNLWDYDYRQIKKDDHVCLDVSLVWDQIGTQIEESKTFGVTTSSKETGRYYLIPFCQDVEGGLVYPTPYLMMRLPAQYNSAMDNQISQTESWWETEGDFEDLPISSIHLDGRIEKIPNDMRKQLEATLSPGERLEDYMLPVLFVPIINPGASKVMSIIGILLVMADLVIIFLVLKGAAGSNPMPAYGAPRTPDYGGGASTTAGAAFSGNQAAPSGTVPFGQAFAGGQTVTPGEPVRSVFAGSQGAAMGSAFAGSQSPAQNTTYGGPQPMPQNPAFGGSQPAAAQPQSPVFGGAQPQSPMFGGSQPAAAQPQSPMFGGAQPATAQPQSSSYSTASLETTQIPYIPGISLGPAPGAAAQSGPSPLGPSSLPGSEPLGPSGGISGPSQSGPSPLGPSSISGSEPQPAPAAPAPATEEKPAMTEEQAAQIAAMSFGSSQPAMLPLGGNAANVQATSQPATLPLGVSPTQVSSGNSFVMPPAQPESTAAPATPPSPIYGSGPATPPSPIYGSGPATPPSPIYGTAPAAAPEKKSAPPAEDENAPLYADNTQMKKVFQGAFANSNNNGNYQ
ncbi:MAG: hypothetical protein IKR23_11020 [Lachnospiraceae bacterium]|nr:hypothetical protein [Lachnospiraceae bacterium]